MEVDAALRVASLGFRPFSSDNVSRTDALGIGSRCDHRRVPVAHYIAHYSPSHISHSNFYLIIIVAFSSISFSGRTFPFQTLLFDYFCLIVSDLFHFYFPAQPNQKHPLRASAFLLRSTDI